MIEINAIKLTDRPVVATCSGDSRFCSTGVSGAHFGAGLAGLSGAVLGGAVFGNERPTKAPAVAEAGRAYAGLSTAVGAGEGVIAAASQKDSATQKHLTIQHLTMWAFRGPEPWRDPA